MQGLAKNISAIPNVGDECIRCVHTFDAQDLDSDRIAIFSALRLGSTLIAPADLHLDAAHGPAVFKHQQVDSPDTRDAYFTASIEPQGIQARIEVGLNLEFTNPCRICQRAARNRGIVNHYQTVFRHPLA